MLLQDTRNTRTYDKGFSLLRVSQRALDGGKEKGEGKIAGHFKLAFRRLQTILKQLMLFRMLHSEGITFWLRLLVKKKRVSYCLLNEGTECYFDLARFK